ncbi:hypothetical protein BLNAU_21110 [Blattamonas nauphoetae]|uniref:Tail specific protease domain-containing protein n=1 Tax=Blattamonas nauphoetae TaxID=2049346 RepID=A0ABQ9WWT9_9EUKA|nr:hypothetical protein BLNAU_21110 [Blattamonas nauphoetae]
MFSSCFVIWALLIPSGYSECTFTTEKVYDWQQARDCIHSVKLDVENNEATRLKQTIDELLDNNVFIDRMHSLPAPFEHLSSDIRKKVSEVPTEGWNSAEEFYAEIAKIFVDIKDAHSVFVKPCSNPFTFVLPFGLSAVYDEEKKYIKISFGDLPASYKKVTDHYLALGGEDLRGVQIAGMIPDQDGLFGDPAKALRKWANDNLYVSKLEPSMFNSALKSDFVARRAHLNPIPNKEERFQITKDNITVTEISLPFYAVVNKDIESMEKLCPIVPQTKQSNSIQEAKEILKISPTKRLVDDVSHFEPTSPSPSQPQNSNEWVTEFESKYINCYSTTMDIEGSSKPVGILRIPVFAPESTEMKLFVDGLTAGMDKLASRNVQYLVVDVRGNGGGYVTLGLRTLQYITGDLFPIMGEYHIRHSAHHDLLYNAGLISNISHRPFLQPSTSSPKLESTWYTDSDIYTFNSTTGSRFQAKYSQRYSMEICDDERQWEKLYRVLKKGAKKTFDAHHLLFVTDGLCGSTCACFLKRAQEARKGRIFFVGTPPAETDGVDLDVAYDVASFAGGSVLDSDFLFAFSALFPHPTDKKKPNLIPSSFPRTGSRLRWAFEEIFSLSHDTRDEVLEFKVNEPDHKLPVFPSTDDYQEAGYTRLLSAMSKKLTGVECEPWEVLPNAECKADTEHHSILGNPCTIEGKWDTQTCVHAKCEPGFYDSSLVGPAPKCVAIPKIYEESSMTFRLIPLWVILGFLALSALIVVFYFIHRTNKKNKMKYQTINDNSKAEL